MGVALNDFEQEQSGFRFSEKRWDEIQNKNDAAGYVSNEEKG
jgi:hypothetical protein